MKKVLRLLLIQLFFLLVFISFKIPAFAQDKPAILLQPDFQQLDIGEKFSVDVLVNSSKKLVGADVIMNFDSQVLEVVSIDNGDAFTTTALKAIGKERIKITGVTNKNKQFSGLGRLAIVHFKAKDAGDVSLKLDFSSGSTTDSNLTTVKVQDVLEQVGESHLVIGSPLQRGVAGGKRLIVRLFPILVFLIFLGIAGFLAYRWWKQQQGRPKSVFVPEKVPLDKPPPKE